MEAQFDLIGLVVQDMARALAFYRHLGFDLPPEADGEPHVETTLAGGLRLAWDTAETVRSFDAAWTPPAGGHRIALAFKLPAPSGVDATYARMVGLGYSGHKAPWDAFWGQRYAVLHDPDGNSVELFAALPG